MRSGRRRGRASVRWKGGALSWLLILLAGTTGGAQTPRPESPRPLEEAPLEAQAVGPTSTWQVLLGLYGTYDTNVDFLSPDGASAAGLSGRASVAHTRRSPRGQFSFTLRGGGVRYWELTEANRFDGSAGFGASYQLSPRATLSFNAGGSYMNTDLSQILIAAGIQLPRSQTLDYGGGFGLDLRPGEQTTLGLSARYDRVDFDAPELFDTEAGNAIFSLSQRLSARSTLSLTYGFLRTKDLTGGFDSHQAALGWSRTLGKRLTLSLASGAGYAIEPQTEGSPAERWYYYGTAGLSGQIKRSTLSLQLRRSANPAYGLGGNRLSYGAALSAGIPFGRRAHLSLGGVHTWSEDPVGLDLSSKFVSDDANASFSLTFLRRLGLFLGYVSRRYEPEGGAAVVSHGGSLGLTWTYKRP